jgi:hypothetical protein
MRLLPDSHRKRVRLLWGSIITIVVIGLTITVVFFGNTGHTEATPINTHQQAQVVRTPKTVPATAEEKRAAESTLSRFVSSAFVRQDLAASWSLADAHMRTGVSYKDWLAGNLPVYPYPAAALKSFGLTLKYSYKGILGYDVLLVPNTNAAGKHSGQQVYSCELHDVHNSWLVDFCYPRKTL